MAKRRREARIATVKLLIVLIGSMAAAWVAGEPAGRHDDRVRVAVAAVRS